MFFQNKKRNEYHELIDKHNELIDKYNKLIGAYNELKEAYNKEKEKLERLEVDYRWAIKELAKWTKNQKGKKSKINEIMTAKAVELQKQGYSNIKIAKQLSISEGTVRNIFKRLEQSSKSQ